MAPSGGKMYSIFPGAFAAAQKLYENFGTALDFNFYIYPIAMLKRLMN